MNKNNQSGFGHIIVLIGIVVVAAIALIGWRVLNSSTATDKITDTSELPYQEKATTNEADIALQNLGLASFDDIDITKQAVRDYSAHGLKGFYVFGDKLSGGRINPNFEYASLKAGSKIVSPIDGVIGFIKEQPESKDWEVFVQPKIGSMWTIGYDHLTNISVKKGDTVKTGEVLGEPAMQNNGLLRFEIQINKDENGETTHYCPASLLAASVKEKWLAELVTMQNKWESTTGLELYSLEQQNPVGCTVKTLTPKQAEGN